MPPSHPFPESSRRQITLVQYNLQSSRVTNCGFIYQIVSIAFSKAPVFIQFVMGIQGGIAAEVENLVFLNRTADKLFGTGHRWSVIGAGAAQMPMALTSAQMGGHVRVGLEDALFPGRGKLAMSNAEQVTKLRRLIEELGGEIATPDEAREILGLRGGDTVAL